MALNALVIEDIEEHRSGIAAILQDLLFTVAEIGNGADALDFLQRTTPPDLIVVDLVMPVMSGWEFIQQVRRIKGLHDVPIVVVSASSLGPRERDAVNAFIAKPFLIEDLEETVIRLFGLQLPPRCEVVPLRAAS